MKDIDHIPGDLGRPYFKQEQYYESSPLSKDNFHSIKAKEGGRVISCVDGGNNIIFESPSECIHLIRVYFNLFKGRKRVKNVEPFSGYLVSKLQDDHIVSTLYPISSTIPIDKQQFILSKNDVEGGGMVNAGHTVRRYLEWLAAGHAQSEYLNEGDILVKDGALQTSVEEERTYAEEVYKNCIDSGVIITGIAKTSSLLTTSGYPLLAAVRILSQEFSDSMWYYNPLAKNKHPDHKGDMYIVKYHSGSEYVFRSEFHRDQKVPVDDVFEELAVQAKDPIFLGYPYGLVDADKRARVTDEEIKYLRTLGSSSMNKTMRYRVNSMNAHDILSNI